MCNLSFLSEVWQKNSRRHNYKIDELFEMKGITYISTPRSCRRGGGAALVADSEKYTLTKLNIQIPSKLEIVWGLLKPTVVTGKISKIIVSCFYCPPKYKKKRALIDHMTLTLQSLRVTFPDAGVIISGDRNDLALVSLLSIDASLQQIVLKHTRRSKILTVVLTDLYSFYEEPEIVPPVNVDNPLSGAVPSDHNGVVVSPLVTNEPVKRIHFSKTIRPIPQSALDEMGKIITHENWQFMDSSLHPTQLTSLYEDYTSDLVDKFCPEKVITCNTTDKPFITLEMKKLKRRIMREYEKKGKTDRYLALKQKLHEKMIREAQKYKSKIVEQVMSGSRKSAYAALRKLGSRPGEKHSSQIILPAFEDISPVDVAEKVADHFAQISLEYDPINFDNFPPRMRTILSNPDRVSAPQLEEYQVYKRINKAKKPNSTVPGDLPVKVVREFACELATPLTILFNRILDTSQYPRQWVVEHQVPIPKSSPPVDLNDLRNISKTAFVSKVFESFLADWLLPAVRPYIDSSQFGLHGSSINHYLIKLLKFAHEYLDLKEPHAVILAMVDLNKAFNRVSHSMVLEDLFDMHVPPWLLLILVSYLSGRSMILTVNGVSSSPRQLPGSSPQGAFLGIFLFIIKFNGAALRPQIPRNIICRQTLLKCEDDICLKHPKTTHAIFVDDLSEMEAINLKKYLVDDPSMRPRPLKFHERTMQILSPGLKLQQNLHKIERFTQVNKMKINEEKTKVMLFNFSKNQDFPPELSFSNGMILECLEESKLLGVHIQSNLKWGTNTSAIYKKAMSKMWLLRRMKYLKLEETLILDYYLKEIRPLAEHGVPTWNSGLTAGQVRILEKIQRVALHIILNNKECSYQEALEHFDLVTLEARRKQLCTKFALKLFRSEKQQDFFTLLPNRNRRNNILVRESLNRTRRAQNAPHNYLSKLVNENSSKLF